MKYHLTAMRIVVDRTALGTDPLSESYARNGHMCLVSYYKVDIYPAGLLPSGLCSETPLAEVSLMSTR